MRTTLLCKTCSTRIGDYDLKRPEELEAVLLLCHAGGTHSGCHQLDVQMEVGGLLHRSDAKPPTTDGDGKPPHRAAASPADGEEVSRHGAAKPEEVSRPTSAKVPPADGGVIYPHGAEKSGEVLVEVECQHPGCQYVHKRDRYQVPPWAVGAVILLTHAKQEGHVLRAWIDGRELAPL